MKFLFLLIPLVGVVITYWVVGRAAGRYLARKLNVNQTVIEYSVAFIVFLFCSYLWIYTDVYQRLTDMTGIPLQKD